MRTVELYKDTKKFRKQFDDGGFYTRAEMTMKVSEGGLGWSSPLDCMNLCTSHAHRTAYLHVSRRSVLHELRKYADKCVEWCRKNPVGNIRNHGCRSRAANTTSARCPKALSVSPTNELRKDKYDEDLEQFWCEKRTSGKQGTKEEEGLKEKVKGAGASDSLKIGGLRGDLDKEWDRDGRDGCKVEAPAKAATVALDMTHQCN